VVIIVTMKRTSLAHAKAHLSEYVDAAEHHGEHTLIHRHGKPSAVIVPVDVGVPARKKRRGMTSEEIATLWATFEGQGDPTASAVADLLASRR
jgi:prevent-host-death family protein